MLEVSDRWLAMYPGASVGVLALKNVRNQDTTGEFERAQLDLEGRLRNRYSDSSRNRLKAQPTLAVYGDYYKRFRKTYHVLLQLETVVLKDEPISGPSPLVEAMFMAELSNLLLTAGHDLDHVEGSLIADVAVGDERYQRLGGQDQGTKAEDMMIRDEAGILSTVLYGPDHRTRLRATTRVAMFTVYAPHGISREDIRAHLLELESYVSLIADDSERQFLQVFP